MIMPEQNLNSDALKAGLHAGGYAYSTGGDDQDVALAAIKAYASALPAQPDTVFDAVALNKAGWTCGCEPGNYDRCFTCCEMCNDLAHFLNGLNRPVEG